MKTAIICFSDAGASLSLKIAPMLSAGASDIHSTKKFAEKYGFTGHDKV